MNKEKDIYSGLAKTASESSVTDRSHIPTALVGTAAHASGLCLVPPVWLWRVRSCDALPAVSGVNETIAVMGEIIHRPASSMCVLSRLKNVHFRLARVNADYVAVKSPSRVCSADREHGRHESAEGFRGTDLEDPGEVVAFLLLSQRAFPIDLLFPLALAYPHRPQSDRPQLPEIRATCINRIPPAGVSFATMGND